MSRPCIRSAQPLRSVSSAPVYRISDRLFPNTRSPRIAPPEVTIVTPADRARAQSGQDSDQGHELPLSCRVIATQAVLGLRSVDVGGDQPALGCLIRARRPLTAPRVSSSLV